MVILNKTAHMKQWIVYSYIMKQSHKLKNYSHGFINHQKKNKMYIQKYLISIKQMATKENLQSN